jgi:hypothetical protein
VQVNCTVHVNSAIHEQCSELLLIALYSTVQLACTVNTKQQNAASSFLRHRRKKHVGSIHSKLCMDCYQTAADCVLIKTQLQPRKQTDPNFVVWISGNQTRAKKILM